MNTIESLLEKFPVKIYDMNRSYRLTIQRFFGYWEVSYLCEAPEDGCSFCIISETGETLLNTLLLVYPQVS